MPTLEQICKRLFNDTSWFMKSLLGALLLLVPIAHFWAFGYMYEMMDQARRGIKLEFPEWGDWRRLFSNGVVAFVLFVVFTGIPLLFAWLLSMPLQLMHYGAVAYIPMIPAALLAGPLTAASIYQFQKREEYRDAFQIGVLLRMLRATRGYFLLPTFSLIGFLTAGYPLMTLTVFVGFSASICYYAVVYRVLEENSGGTWIAQSEFPGEEN